MSYVGPRPRRRHGEGASPELTDRGLARPVVAVLDSGTGPHPWLPEGVVVRDPRVLGVPVGTFPVPANPEEDCEIGGMSIQPLTGPLDPVAGHGTFISGLVHQQCPDALILAARLYGGTGFIAEWDLLRSLRRLLMYQLLALQGRKGYLAVDVLVLACGYRHERPEDALFDAPFAGVLRALRRHGVAVVVSAGNSGSLVPLYPAAFAPWLDHSASPPVPLDDAGLEADLAPLVSVGALNPNGTTALFSNDGPWVTCQRPGAGLVSTMPITMRGSRGPSAELAGRRPGERRATIDLDDFAGGFGTWSGTSFAAPLYAGEIASALLESRASGKGGAGATVPERCKEAWKAVSTTAGLGPVT